MRESKFEVMAREMPWERRVVRVVRVSGKSCHDAPVA